MVFKNIVYEQAIERTTDEEKGAKRRTRVYVTREINCVLVWCSYIVWAYRHDEDATTDNSIIKSFPNYETSNAIECAVDWIRSKERESR